jgi:transcriptional regulator of arginine metabolism
MSKKLEEIQKRHSLIKNLISTQEIFNQTQLQKILKKNGVEVTQATLSRDLSELGVLRVPSNNGVVYKINPAGDESTLKNYIAEEIISIESNECMIVLKTFPGRAPGVAIMVDKQNASESLGTIAGDDTVLIIPRSTKNIKKTIEQIKTTLGIQ